MSGCARWQRLSTKAESLSSSTSGHSSSSITRMVSIIIPTYNEEGCLPTTLAHLRQVRGEFEVIIADGNSTDRTCELVRIAVFGFPRPLRLVKAVRNRAIQLNSAAQTAHGDFFLFLHADIVAPPEAVESIEHCLRDPSVIGAIFRSYLKATPLSRNSSPGVTGCAGRLGFITAIQGFLCVVKSSRSWVASSRFLSWMIMSSSAAWSTWAAQPA